MIKEFTATYTSPIGFVQIVAQEDSIRKIKFTDESASKESEDTTSVAILNEGIRQLEEYFEGNRKDFELKLSYEGTEFEKEVWSELMKIPFGKTISYEELAIRLGDIKKIRAAAHANGNNPLPIVIPCHRVIGKDGSLVGYASGLQRKEWLLSHEGAIAKQYSIF